jgi:D-alanyl-D-alanine carboxypeptidase
VLESLDVLLLQAGAAEPAAHRVVVVVLGCTTRQRRFIDACRLIRHAYGMPQKSAAGDGSSVGRAGEDEGGAGTSAF